MSYDLIEHIKRQAAFSESAFGPGTRLKGVTDHIRKELAEVAQEDDNGDSPTLEWVDVVILALDGEVAFARLLRRHRRRPPLHGQ